MAVVPDPHKLLLTDPDHIPSFFKDLFYPLFGGTIGLGGVVVQRVIARRPIFSGIQQHILVAGIVAAIGYFGKARYNIRNDEKNAIYMHYISLHPEDFPMPERKKIGEIFPKFTPVR